MNKALHLLLLLFCICCFSLIEFKGKPVAKDLKEFVLELEVGTFMNEIENYKF